MRRVVKVGVGIPTVYGGCKMAQVKQPAPYWSGTALWKDDFEELSSDQYKGYLVRTVQYE